MDLKQIAADLMARGAAHEELTRTQADDRAQRTQDSIASALCILAAMKVAEVIATQAMLPTAVDQREVDGMKDPIIVPRAVAACCHMQAGPTGICSCGWDVVNQRMPKKARKN